jgi:hypothetical protein
VANQRAWIVLASAAFSLDARVGAGRQTEGTPPIAAVASAFLDQSAATPTRFDISPRLWELAARAPSIEIVSSSEPEPPDVDEDRFGTPTVDAVAQTPFAPSAMPATLVEFTGTNGAGNVSPPDPMGDIGKNDYVALGNLQFAIYDRAGNLRLGPVATNVLWAGFGGACETQNAGTAVVLYDQFADRWMFSQFTTVGSFNLCVAVSMTGDPTGSYFRWVYGPTTNFMDFPRWGLGRDGYYASVREFGPGGGGYLGVGVLAVDRAALLGGSPAATAIHFLVPLAGEPYQVGDGLLPADVDGDRAPAAGAPHYFVGTMDQGGPYGAPQDALTFWKFDANFAEPASSTFTREQTLSIAAYDTLLPAPCSATRDCIPQPGASTSQYLDFLGYRQRPSYRLAYRNSGTHETLVTNQSVNAGLGPSGAVAGMRWWEIRVQDGVAALHQEGTFAPGLGDGVHRWMGSAAMDRNGNLALGYSASSATVFPSIRYAGRLAADPPGQLAQGEGEIIAGAGIQQSTGSRWGNSTSMNVDVDDCTFWYINEYYPVSSQLGWRTHVAAFRFPDCAHLFSDGWETGTSARWSGTAP